MHIVKTTVYSGLANLDTAALLTGFVMGCAMVGGTLTANRFIRKLDKNRFQRYVAVLLCAVGLYMLIMG